MAVRASSETRIREQLAPVTRGLRGMAAYLSGLSGVINLLALTGSFYMMQVYDRALSSGSVPTLVAISVIAAGLFVFQGLLDTLRGQILLRLGARLDAQVAPAAHRITLDMPRFGFSTSEAVERGRDVDVLRGFLGGQGPVALLDLPWMPIFVVFVYALHPLLGALTLGGAVLLAVIAVASEVLTRRLTGEAHRAAVQRNALAEGHARNADVIRAMGFSSAAVARFVAANDRHLALQARASDVSGTLGSLSKVLRMMLQSAVLGLGAWLAIRGEMSPGAIMAASVASARALAPIDMAIGNWKGLLQARGAWQRLKDTLSALPDAAAPMDLPAPTRSFAVEGVTVAVPATGRVILSDVSFELTAGQALGIIGPSGGGKTTLMRALTGVWPALRGHVRIDGADLPQWSDAAISRAVGYLPQDYGLFDATIERNIARLQDPDPQAVVRAARAAGVHDMILRLPEGYQTDLGPSGTALSAGQRQRIGLARALYGEPFLVLLDEPNANLDSEGEQAVATAIEAVKARGGIAVVIAHRPSALKAVDLVAVIRNGKLAGFGPREEILRAKAAVPAAPAASAAPAPAAAAAADPSGAADALLAALRQAGPAPAPIRADAEAASSAPARKVVS